MAFLKFIYYSFGVLFIIHELTWLLLPIQKAKEYIELRVLAKKYKGLKWDDYPEDFKNKIKSKIFALSFLVWFILGIFTFQWSIFIVFMVLQFGIVSLLSAIFYRNLYVLATLHWINSLIGLVFACFVILNAYHLKIDTYSYFMHFIR